jgi:hypothetical protein
MVFLSAPLLQIDIRKLLGSASAKSDMSPEKPARSLENVRTK